MRQNKDRGPLGLVQANIISLVLTREMYGLEISKRLRLRGFEVGANQLYPTLKRLTAIGAIESRRDDHFVPTRIYYRATQAGKAMLVQLSIEVAGLFGDLLAEKITFIASDAMAYLDIPPTSIVVDMSKDHFEEFYKILVPPISPVGRYYITCFENETPAILKDRIDYLGFSDVMQVIDLGYGGSVRLPDKSVDVILCFFTMRGDTASWAIQHASRLLKAGGRLAIADWVLEKQDPRRKFMADTFRDRGGVDPQEIQAMLEKNVFHTEKIEIKTGILQAFLKKN